jgi:serine phosphatase RsbU (regulator of sigma subunit)
MDQIHFDEELRMGAQYLAQRLMPTTGVIPQIPGFDMFGVSIPHNGVAGGDLVTYVNFQERFDLDARIERALAQKLDAVAQTLQSLKRKGGILVADVAGHNFTDAARALLLHQAFHTATLYELDLNGEITLRLFEQVNTRFAKSTTLRNLAADPDASSFITLLYGEIASTGRFRFFNAGHPVPLVFSREYDRFVDISADRLVSYPPIGLQLTEDHPDAKRYHRALGYKKLYTSNELNLMGQGDLLFLYTDGLLDPCSPFTQPEMERVASSAKDATAREICERIVQAWRAAAEPSDDMSLVVIKRN